MNKTSGRVLTSAEKIIQPKRLISQRRPRVILAATGFLSAWMFPTLCRCFLEWAEVVVVFTNSSLNFMDVTAIPNGIPLYTDNDDWSSWRWIDNLALHVELRQWADLMVIAPLSANSLSKISAGLCDNLLTCIVRGWDYTKPLYIAPSMHIFLWNNRATEQQLAKTRQLGMILIMPVTTRLAFGDLVTGLMGEPADIYYTVRSSYSFSPGNPR